MRTEQDELDDLKHQAHKAFDSLWQGGRISRDTAYTWMQVVMNLPRRKAHIAKLSRGELLKLLAKVQEFKNKNGYGKN